MGLISRLRTRVERRLHPVPTGIGNVLTPALEKEWEDLPEQVDACMKKIGSAVVSSWEVGAAELGRAVIGYPNNQALINRYSDALVPTLAPYQDLHKRCDAQMLAARNAAKKAGMSAAVPEWMEIVRGLGPRAAEGWGKTLAYLEPVLALCQDPPATRREMEKLAAILEESAAKGEVALRRDLESLPNAPRLFEGMCDAFENYHLQMGRDLEIGLDRAVRRLIQDIRR